MKILENLPWGLAVAGLLAGGALADEPLTPTFRSFAGSFPISGARHQYFVESELLYPMLQLQPFHLYYHYMESTPFLEYNNGPHADLLYRRYELQGDYVINDYLRLIVVGGERAQARIDEPGSLAGTIVGGGLGSPLQREAGRFEWSIVAGGFVSQQAGLPDWWADAHVHWRVVDFAKKHYEDSRYRVALSLGLDVESANHGADFEALYKAGPAVQMRTAHGNQAALQLLWFRNDGNAFYGRKENSMLFGFEVQSSLDSEYVFHAARDREEGWLPLIWGLYDMGIANDRRLVRFTVNAELLDCKIGEQPFTGTVWYESRQEYRSGGDFDNIAYSVSLGMQTPIGCESILSHGDPLVLGGDFLHRSDHSLDPNEDRFRMLPPGTLLKNGSHNLLPRLRLQTRGWDLPYRDAEMYRRVTEWLNTFDWRVTAGYTINDSNRNRNRLCGQLGLNWDIATIEGCVVYALGQISAGNETPDWLAEFGVRRPLGHVFTRFERYGMKHDLANGNTWVLGAGVNL